MYPKTQVDDSFLQFKEVPTDFVTVLSLFLLIQIFISCLIHVRNYEYLFHGCIYFIIHDGLYILEWA